MFRVAKFFRDQYLFVHIIIISFMVFTTINIVTGLVNGEMNETLLYKGFSVLLALVALLALKAAHEMWGVVDDVMKDIKKLKEKGHDLGTPGPMKMFGNFPGGSKGIELSDEDVKKMQLITSLINKKEKEPVN